jgi:hypothetical protein
MSIMKRMEEGYRITLVAPRPLDATRMVVGHDPLAVPLGNMLTIAAATEQMDHSGRVTAWNLPNMLGKARFGLHFAPKLVELADKSIVESPEIDEEGEGDPGDDGGAHSEDDGGSGWTPAYATPITNVMPMAMQVVLEPDSSVEGTDKYHDTAVAMWRALGSTLGMTARAASRQLIPMDVIDHAIDQAHWTVPEGSKRDADKRRSLIIQKRVGVGPYLLRPASIYTLERATCVPNAKTGLTEAEHEMTFARFLLSLDASGWSRALLTVRNDDPRLEGGHPNHPATQMRKRLIMAERLNSLLLIYRMQLMLFWLRCQRPFTDAAHNMPGFPEQAKTELDHVLAMLEAVPLHPVLSALADSNIKATAVVHEMNGPALTLPWKPRRPPTYLMDSDGQLWTHIPWLGELARVAPRMGWESLIEAAGYRELDKVMKVPADQKIRRATVARILATAQAIRLHVQADPAGWQEAQSFLGWKERPMTVPPASISIAKTPYMKTDGLAADEDPWQAVLGTRALIPAYSRKLATDVDRVVRTPKVEWSPLPVQILHSIPIRQVVGVHWTIAPKWTYMGEPTQKLYLRAWVTGEMENGASVSDVLNEMALIIGPHIGSAEAPFRLRVSAGAYQPTHIWPARPGAPIYDTSSLNGTALRFVNNMITGRRFSPDRSSDAAFQTILGERAVGDLADDYNGGGGLLHIIDSGTKIAAASGLKPYPLAALIRTPDPKDGGGGDSGDDGGDDEDDELNASGVPSVDLGAAGKKKKKPGKPIAAPGRPDTKPPTAKTPAELLEAALQEFEGMEVRVMDVPDVAFGLRLPVITQTLHGARYVLHAEDGRYIEEYVGKRPLMKLVPGPTSVSHSFQTLQSLTAALVPRTVL